MVTFNVYKCTRCGREISIPLADTFDPNDYIPHGHTTCPAGEGTGDHELVYLRREERSG
jgi:hypothetical protein